MRTEYTLTQGSHPTREDGMCLMEAVAWLAGEEHSDQPKCACPVLAAYGRVLNDAMGKGQDGDALRTEYLHDLAPRLVGSRSTVKAQSARALVLADHAVRVLAPLALESAGLGNEAARLRALGPVAGLETALETANAAVWDADWDTAEAAARDAARAARAAARAASWAAEDSAWAASGAARAAWAASGAARAAVWVSTRAASEAAGAAVWVSTRAAEAAGAAAWAAESAEAEIWAAARAAFIAALEVTV